MAFMIDYGDDWRAGYVDLCERVVRYGTPKDSRVGYVHEMRDFMFTLDGGDTNDLPYAVGRKVTVALAAAEAIQLCCGVGMPDLTEAVSSQIASFVRDPDGTVHGNYGARVDWQLADIIDKLTLNPNDRQAVIQIWNKMSDSRVRRPMPKDIPCTLVIVFSIEDDELFMSVMMRSNDVWLGVPYDVFQFRQMQRTVAYLLGVGVGQYTHHAVSMHAYERNHAEIAGLSVNQWWTRDDLKGGIPTGIEIPDVRDADAVFHGILAGSVPLLENSLTNRWYNQFLKDAYATALG